jgi:hypothetical protein
VPFKNDIGKEVTRSTICVDRWVVAVTLMCADRIPEGSASPLSLAVTWRRKEDEQLTPGAPEDAGPVVVAFAPATPSAPGDIRFDRRDGDRQKQFPPRDVNEVLTIFGQRASAAGAGAPDVNLTVTIEEEQRAALPLSVGPLATTLAVMAENGTDPAPATLAPGARMRLRAVPAPAGPGAYRWLSLSSAALRVVGSAEAEVVEVAAESAAGRLEAGPVRLCVLFTPAGGGPAVMAVHGFDAVDLEGLFAAHRLHARHLERPEYRRRLEELRPPAVQAFVDEAERSSADERLRDYLRRLLAFVTEQEPLRAAPAGERQSITVSVGEDGDDFYRAAHAFFTLNPAGRLVLPADLGTTHDRLALSQVRDLLESSPPTNGLPWGEVNLISHGNEEGGMDVPAVPLTNKEQENRAFFLANVENLGAAVADGRFRPLPDGLVDARTTIRFRGCALGRSQEMLRRLSTAFGAEGDTDRQRPIVRAPRHLQGYYFTAAPGWSTASAQPPSSADDYYVEFWLLGFPAGHVPPERDLVARFRDAYPDVDVDWAVALAHRGDPVGDRPSNERRDRLYRFQFDRWYYPIPTSQTRLRTLLVAIDPSLAAATNLVETSRSVNANGTVVIGFEYTLNGAQETNTVTVGPSPPASDAERLALFRDQPEIQTDLARVGHTFDDYTWTFDPQRDTAGASGKRDLQVVGYGRHTIVRVQRELRGPDPDHPGVTRRLRPPVTDLTHFGEEVPVREPAHPLGENVQP